MNQLELLSKSKHVIEWSDEVPDKALIEKILWNTWKVTRSKNSFMPYHVNVLGPDKTAEKTSIWEKTKVNDVLMNEKNKDYVHPATSNNKLFEQLASAPYTIVMSQRICEPNPLYKRHIEGGGYYEQMDNDAINGQMCALIETGMFYSNLTAFALEEGLDTSCILCFSIDMKDWEDLDFVKECPLLLVTIGKCKESRREWLNDIDSADDKKPEPETVINWV